jgi:hypothetical protein
MENQNLTFVTFDNIPSVIAKVSNNVSIIRSKLKELKESFEPKSLCEYLTRGGVAKMLKCNISTIHNWTVQGKLKKYCFGNSTYYKRC